MHVCVHRARTCVACCLCDGMDASLKSFFLPCVTLVRSSPGPSTTPFFPLRTRAARIDNFVTTLLSLHRQFQWPLPTKGGISLSPPSSHTGGHSVGLLPKGSDRQSPPEDASRLIDRKAFSESECSIYTTTGSNYAIIRSNFKQYYAIAGSNYAIAGSNYAILGSNYAIARKNSKTYAVLCQFHWTYVAGVFMHSCYHSLYLWQLYATEADVMWP